MMQFPVILYNSQLQTTVTKDFLSNQEKENFIEHSVLYLNMETRRIGSDIRDFARYVIENLKPNWMSGKAWVWIILVVGIIIIVAIFAPKLLQAIQGKSTQAIDKATNNPVTNPAIVTVK
jgi:hypothetical protein